MTITDAIRNRLNRATLESVKREVRNQRNRITAWRELAGLGYRSRAATSDLFPGVDASTVVSDLRRDGICRGFRLRDDILADLLAYSSRALVFADRSPDLGFLMKDRAQAELAWGKPFGLATYFNTFDDCETARRLARDPLLQEIAMRYVGPRCKCFGTNMWWAFPYPQSTAAERDRYAQRFHYDLDAERFIKFFFYLSDVDLESGPHVFVRGTHKRKRVRHLWPKRRLSDHDVVAAYGSGAVQHLNGPAGIGFAEDTFGLHKGLTPTRKSRLIFQIEFGIASEECRVDSCDRAEMKTIPIQIRPLA